jgi:hypothetical protein
MASVDRDNQGETRTPTTMRAIDDWDENYLNKLIQEGEKESLTLDYKQSAALAKQDRKK